MRPAILGLLGSLDTVKGDIKRSIERFREAEVLYRALGDVEGSRMSLIGLAQSIAESGAIEEGLKAMDSVWALMGQSSCTEPALEGELLLARAVIHHLSSAYEQALSDVAEARTRFIRAGFELSQLGSRIYEAKILIDAHRDGARGFPPDLPERVAGFVNQAERFGSPSLSIIAHVTLAEAQDLAARPEEARVEASWALRQSRELPYPPGVVRSLEALARLDHDREMAIQARNLWMSMGCTVWAARLEREWGLERAVENPDECDPT